MNMNTKSILTIDLAGTGWMLRLCEETGKMLNWSSITMQFLHDARESKNLQCQTK